MNQPASTEDRGVDFQALEGEMELTAPEVYASNLIEWAVDRHASDLFVSDSEHSVVVAVRRLGQVETVRRLARNYGRKLQRHLRVLAGADGGDVVRPAEGRGILQTPDNRSIDLRLSSIPTLFGQDVAIRLFDPVNGARPLDALGYSSDETEIIRGLISRPSGLILVAGPIASGKSSTLYAAIDHLNDGTRKIHTLEDPIEHAVPGVMQSQVNLRAGLDFADLLASVLRHSPDVIMIGEIRDRRTAETAVRAGASGQLVLATIHAKSAAEAIDSLMQYDANPKFVASSLVGVVNQRLLRKLCTECRSPLTTSGLEAVSPRVTAAMRGVPMGIYEAGSCDACFADGYDSLTCVPEILCVDSLIADRIAAACPASEVESAACQNGMLHLSEVVATRVLEGTTTVAEAQRVVSNPLISELQMCVRE
ncbi:MAG: ATPase, T2SS/T4P/T4SS family [Planctomycetota bacterium]